MPTSDTAGLTIEVKHTGERLTLRRMCNAEGVEELHLSGTLPAHRERPPLHIHFAEDEHGEVLAGTLSAVVDGRTFTAGVGESSSFLRGSVHRWWNDSDEELSLRGVATPVVDLDRYLQAVFEVLNAGPPNRPPLFYMAHVLHRHRHTQRVLIGPALVQRVLFPVVIFVGTLLGKYRGTDWPGCPERCGGAPLVEG